mgnify:CR=1 FL=1
MILNLGLCSSTSKSAHLYIDDRTLCNKWVNFLFHTLQYTTKALSNKKTSDFIQALVISGVFFF